MMLALAFLTGCTGDLSAYMPAVKFKEFRVNDIDFEYIDVDFVFDVENPNPVGIPIERFDYALGFEGIEFISGDDPNGLQVAADASSEVALPVGIVFQDLYDVVQATRGLDYIAFYLEGNFGFDTSIGPVDIGIDEDGSFPAVRTPRIDLSDLRIGDLSGSAAEFNLDLAVDNDHGSTLDFTDLAFDVGVAGVDVGGGEMEEVASVEGASSKTVTIPFSVDYLDAVEAIGAAASGQRVAVDLAATVDVDTPFGVLPLSIDEQGNVSVSQE